MHDFVFVSVCVCVHLDELDFFFFPQTKRPFKFKQGRTDCPETHTHNQIHLQRSEKPQGHDIMHMKHQQLFTKR